jgi:hypothetical protein
VTTAQPTVTPEPEPAPRKKPTSHIPRALAELRKRGYVAAVVERRAWLNTTVDLFGCLDILGVHLGHGILGVQVTVGGAHAEHLRKMLGEPRLAAWLRAGGRAALWSYAKQGAEGERKLWTLREQAITIGDMGVEAGPALDSPRKAAARERAQAKRAQTRLRLSPPPTLH